MVRERDSPVRYSISLQIRSYWCKALQRTFKGSMVSEVKQDIRREANPEDSPALGEFCFARNRSLYSTGGSKR